MYTSEKPISIQRVTETH